MEKKFIGDVKWIDPKFLVTENKYDRIESFFLGLGVIFNDLKGLILFEKLLLENYGKPGDKEVSSHAGNYGGIIIQVQKLIASTISEFFIFLKKNSYVFTNTEFKEILKRIPKSDMLFWYNIVAAAHGRFPTTTDLLKTMIHIRSNIAFHYDHSGKILRKAYISRFFGREDNDRSKKAYYSIGESTELTRFYFSDAAVEESLFLAAGKGFKKSSQEDISFETYRQEIRETIEVMSSTIISLLRAYIQLRRNRPH